VRQGFNASAIACSSVIARPRCRKGHFVKLRAGGGHGKRAL